MARRRPVRHLTTEPSETPPPSAPEPASEGGAVRKRSRARELALQCLYQLDLRGSEAEVGIDQFITVGDGDPAVREFARLLVQGCWEHRADVDEKIAAVAQNWHLNRMAAIDRNILRAATYELLFLPDVPAKVSINEAIDLAKKYSTAESGAFVNGILDKIRANYAASK